nr:UvrD-helicase domain-containing protein [Pedobacter sp. MR2016-19]
MERRAIIITYTNNNLENLRNGIVRKWGYIPENIKLLSYFNFLYTYCYRPFLSFTIRAKGINWKPNLNIYAKNDARYIDDYNRLYSNRIAKLLEEKQALQDVNDRLSKYFDIIFIDEVQDFAGHDFNLLKSIAKTQVEMLFVGDFYQHTFDTSRDGKVNSTLHDDYAKYKQVFEKMGVKVDTASLIKSHRCNAEICNFILEKIGIAIKSHRADTSQIKIVDNDNDAQQLFRDNNIIKLFYQEHQKYGCHSRNWGECKGEDKYNDVCVVLNKNTWDHYNKNILSNLPAQTKNKLYVACSRTKKDLYIVSDEYYKQHKKKN